jgi:hypothetical protein
MTNSPFAPEVVPRPLERGLTAAIIRENAAGVNQVPGHKLIRVNGGMPNGAGIRNRR